MKKLVCIILVLVLTIGSAMPVFSAVDDSFTLSLVPEKETILPSTGDIDIKLNISSNPGIWAMRCYIVYPEGMSLEAIENGDLFGKGSLMKGIFDLPLSDSRQPDDFEELISSQGIATEGYRSVTVYFEMPAIDRLMTEDGDVATFTFSFTEELERADRFEVSVYTCKDDVIRAEVDASDKISFTKYAPDTESATVTVACDHPEITDVRLEPTCRDTGYERTVCVHCGEIFFETVLDATGIHTEGRSETDLPTCVKGGEERVYCLVCEELIFRTELFPTGKHIEGDQIRIEPTCTSEGSITVYCANCLEVISTEILPVLDHTPSGAASCTEESFCTVCGVVLEEPFGHDESDIIKVEPTCAVGGTYITYCLRCGKVLSREAIPPLRHTPGREEIIEPTCTNEGVCTVYCSVCEKVASETVIPPLGHTYGREEIKEPNCTNEGILTVYCLVCSEIAASKVILPLGHIYEPEECWNVIEPDCINEGYTEKTCIVCRETLVSDIIEPEGHDTDGNTEIREPSCDAAGKKTFYCSKCNEISKIEWTYLEDHSYVDGICSVCGSLERYFGVNDFAVCLDPVRGEKIDAGEDFAVDLSIRNNPGIWAARVFIVYPDALTLVSCKNGNLFNRSGFVIGETDLPLTDSSQVKEFQELIIKEGIPKEGFRSVTLYFECSSVSDNITADGILATLYFKPTETAQLGSSYPVSVYSAEGDIIDAHIADNGMPVFTKHTPLFFNTRAVSYCSHGEVYVEEKAPTCANAGYKNILCSYCDTILESEAYPPTGLHIPGDEIKNEPDCVNAGYGSVSCTVCNTLLLEKIYPATNIHTGGAAETIEPTCTSDGRIIVRCKVCSALLSETVIPLSGHKSEKSATCTEDEICMWCSYVLAPATGHSEGEAIMIFPTCTDEGQGNYYCQGCATLLRSEVIEALGHSYEKEGSITVIHPTCTVGGYTEKVCDRCSESVTVNITPPAGHDARGREDIIEATCTSTGYANIYCSACGEFSGTILLPIKGHSYVDGVCTVCDRAVGSGNYDEFTIDIYTDAEVSIEAPFKAELRVENNPGIWALRCYIVYPDAFSLKGVENGTVFPKGSLMKGVFDLSVSDDSQVDSFKELIKKKGIPKDGYCAVALYFESDSISNNISGNGVLADLTFEFTSEAVFGENYDIWVYTGEDDVINAYVNENGMPTFVKYTPDTVGSTVKAGCSHNERDTLLIEGEDGKTYIRVVCTLCRAVIMEVVPPESADGAYIPGDINADGKVNSMDSSYMKRFLQGALSVGTYERIVADLNGDGKLNSIDSNILVRLLAGDYVM